MSYAMNVKNIFNGKIDKTNDRVMSEKRILYRRKQGIILRVSYARTRPLELYYVVVSDTRTIDLYNNGRSNR